MIRYILGLLLTLLSSSLSTFAQTAMDLGDNIDLLSGQNIKLNPGTYTLKDPDQDGLIRIKNQDNITIDGSNVEVSGLDSSGYLIHIDHCTGITIRNFKSVQAFYYAVRIENSSGISIEDNNFSYNKKDTLGWIYIWTGPEAALGGGVLMVNCSSSELSGNTMIQQNDGIALYNSEQITIFENTLNWNCGFGVRMNYTDHCHIHHNDCSHVNRLTDPSDCASILLIVSNNNVVEYNDLSYSGDGVFLGQYEHSEVPNNNYFAYNDCSFSPHNAIEATFADGNIYKYNKCNYSHYGFWLGYSFNSLVEGNEVIGNLQSGIAVDRGYSNTFIDNEIRQNPYGFDLWEGAAIAPYEDQNSHSYYIINNTISGNTWGIFADHTEHLIAKQNDFIHNREADILTSGKSFNDTISNNYFSAPTFYFIKNMSEDGLYASDNSYFPDDRELISRKMRGNISWLPYSEGTAPKMMMHPPCDLAEPQASWTIYPDPGYGKRMPETLAWDYDDKILGDASLKMVTGRGWDVALNYRPPGDSLAYWNLSEQDTLTMWIKTIKNPVYGFQFFTVRVGNYDQGYYLYTGSPASLNNAHNRWSRVRIPLRGSTSFARSTVGAMSLDQVHYVEIHADTWDFGYTLWLDGIQFKKCTPTGMATLVDPKVDLKIYPNPMKSECTLHFNLSSPQKVRFCLYNTTGTQVSSRDEYIHTSGEQELTFRSEDLPNGLYFYQFKTDQELTKGKLLLAK